MTYTRTAIAFHWILAALIIGNLAFGFTIVDLPLSPAKLRYFSWHKWTGVTIFILAALRLAWRLRHRAPELPSHMEPWERKASHVAHIALYVLFFAAPLTGWLFSSAAGFQTVYFGLLPIPDLLPRNHEVAEALKLTHHAVNYALAGVVTIHAAAALKHHLVDHDDVLARMLPLLKRSP
jgi:cytochrome b561